MQEADLLLTAMIGKPDDLKVLDYPTNWYTAPFGILIPYPKESHNHARAVIEPLTTEVWITAVASLVAVLVAVYVLLHCRVQKDENRPGRFSYTTINILSQGFHNFFFKF